MPLDPKSLGAALNEDLTLHSTLCRREATAYLQALQSGDEVVVACTQEKRLFTELAVEAKAQTSVLRFVNIREMGGWSKDARQASPKIAALLAAGWIAVAFPHVLLSRYGFRAISQPLLQALTVAALWRGLRTGKRAWLVAGGACLGLTGYSLHRPGGHTDPGSRSKRQPCKVHTNSSPSISPNTFRSAWR